MARTMKALATVCCLALACTLVQADVYLHYIRGGNNRLNEGGQGRNNGDRLWDSQNNNRGGYNAGSVLRNYFYEDTTIPIEWTQQHSCGDATGNNCEIILQYACGDKYIRDGTTTETIPQDNDDGECDDADGNCDQMMQYGRHESLASYQNCRYRSRNKGLFTANQHLRGRSARFTRQNNNGGRSGLECPEERDYYPYWHPTAWKDIAIITNRPSRCAAFQSESQNVKARFFCDYDPNHPDIVQLIEDEEEGWLPINQTSCEDPVNFPTGKWTRVEPFNIPAPDCLQAAYTRDNHLGNAVMQGTDPSVQTNGFPNYYNWTIRASPEDYSANCVFRLRYNISTGEFPNQGFTDDYNVYPSSSLDSSTNMQPLDKNHPDTKARYPSLYPLWERYGMTFAENAGSFTKIVQDDDANSGNNGEDGAGGIRQAQPPSRDYTLRNNPKVDIFGSLLPGNATNDAAYRGQPLIRLRLAVNTAQFGRTFEDRSHTFEIRKRPANLKGVKIHNLSVRGKKGNIVQVYPSVEYDFVPDHLEVSQGDMIHIQWTGSVPSEEAEGQGNNGDRSNIVMLRPRNYVEEGQDQNLSPFIGHIGNNYPALINDTANNPAFLGFDFKRLRQLALYGINSSHFDLGPVQITGIGEYRYICTRNNAFSNRSHKGTIIVAANATWQALGPAGKIEVEPSVNLHGEAWTQSGKAALKISLPDDAPEGTEVVPGYITIEDHEDEWYRVSPPVPNLGAMQDGLFFEADRVGSGNFFYRGQVLYKLNLDDQPVEQVTASSYYATSNRMSINDGGYYSSRTVPNTAMIAGIAIAVIGLAAILLALYWKVRVQPMGGWKAFCAKDRLADNLLDGTSERLTSPDVASSSSHVAMTDLQQVRTA